MSVCSSIHMFVVFNHQTSVVQISKDDSLGSGNLAILILSQNTSPHLLISTTDSILLKKWFPSSIFCLLSPFLWKKTHDAHHLSGECRFLFRITIVFYDCTRRFTYSTSQISKLAYLHNNSKQISVQTEQKPRVGTAMMRKQQVALALPYFSSNWIYYGRKKSIF